MLVVNGSSETHSYDEFVRFAAIKNEVWLYVRSEGKILPTSVCPLYCQNKGALKDKGWDEHVLGMVDTTESSELIEDSSISPKRAWLAT